MSRWDKLGEQFADNAGDPLVDGKIYVYESGTNTPKNTYADPEETIPNTNPIILSGAGRAPNTFFSGSARMVLTDKDDVQIQVRDPEGAQTGLDQLAPWNALISYDANDLVRGSNGRFYQSIVSGNLGNDPTTSPGVWSESRFLGVWNSARAYIVNDVVTFTDSFLYTSLVDGNLNNVPNVSPSEWLRISELPILTKGDLIVGNLSGAAVTLPVGADGTSLLADSAEALGMRWTFASGDVVGPASAVADNLASFNGTTGKLIKDSGVPMAGVARIDIANTFAGSNIDQKAALFQDTVTVTPSPAANAEITLNGAGAFNSTFSAKSVDGVAGVSAQATGTGAAVLSISTASGSAGVAVETATGTSLIDATRTGGGSAQLEVDASNVARLNLLGDTLASARLKTTGGPATRQDMRAEMSAGDLDIVEYDDAGTLQRISAKFGHGGAAGATSGFAVGTVAPIGIGTVNASGTVNKAGVEYYHPTNPQPGGGMWAYVGPFVVAGGTIDLTSQFSASDEEYEVIIPRIKMVTDDEFIMRWKTGGTVLNTNAYTYQGASAAANAWSFTGPGPSTYMRLHGALNTLASDASEIHVRFRTPAIDTTGDASDRAIVAAVLKGPGQSGFEIGAASASYTGTFAGTLDGCQFAGVSGNAIAAGVTAYLYKRVLP